MDTLYRTWEEDKPKPGIFYMLKLPENDADFFTYKYVHPNPFG